jgi:hypothetical protein
MVRLYNHVRSLAVTVADSARSLVGRAAYLAGLPVAHVLATAADWCGYRDAYEVHAAILRAERRVVAWSERRAPDGRVVAPRLWRCP